MSCNYKFTNENLKVIHFPCGPNANLKITTKTPYMDEGICISKSLSLIFNIYNTGIKQDLVIFFFNFS
jgi:hypothetical protein